MRVMTEARDEAPGRGLIPKLVLEMTGLSEDGKTGAKQRQQEAGLDHEAAVGAARGDRGRAGLGRADTDDGGLGSDRGRDDVDGGAVGVDAGAGRGGGVQGPAGGGRVDARRAVGDRGVALSDGDGLGQGRGLGGGGVDLDRRLGGDEREAGGQDGEEAELHFDFLGGIR